MKGRRVGFTLVELLVVITIISMLMALLLPAVQQAREAGRRATCMNNQKNISTALMSYESAKGRFPGWRQVVGYKQSGQVVVGSWVVELLPYLEMKPLSDRWKDPNVNAKPRTYIPVLACPTDSRNKALPQLNHVVNCGLGRERITVDTETVKIENGVFFDHLYENPIADADMPANYEKAGNVEWTMMEMSNDYLTANDGASNTVLLAENVSAGFWAYPSGGSGKAHSKSEILDRTQQLIGFNWDCMETGNVNDDEWGMCPKNNNASERADERPTRPNGCMDRVLQSSDTAVTYKYARPASHHPGVFIASFCDGRSTTISEGIQLRVYQHIMTPNSRNARGRLGNDSKPDCNSQNAKHLYDPGDL